MSKIYTTSQGDMWDSIALSQLGDEKYAADIMRANTGFLDVYIFGFGTKLVIPDPPRKNSSGSLPPWKKVAL